MPEPRYAIYFIPGRDTALYKFGACVLGYDCYSGQEVPFIAGADAFSWQDIVAEPKIYGFHATLKAPFHLAQGANAADLIDAAQSFAAKRPRFSLGKLIVRELSFFVALVPEASPSALDELARACVKDFDSFRAPMTAAERERRLKTHLSPREIANIDAWGYPYVLDDFRFHMTLTGALPSPVRTQALALLCDRFTYLAPQKEHALDQIAIAMQLDKSLPFQVIAVAPLGANAAR